MAPFARKSEARYVRSCARGEMIRAEYVARAAERR